MAQLAEPLMKKGGISFADEVLWRPVCLVKNYNIMTEVAKATLESAVRSRVGRACAPKGRRYFAISPGPLATRAASGIPKFDKLLEKAKAKAPSRSLVNRRLSALQPHFLAHDAARLITGDPVGIDGGYHVVEFEIT